MKENLNIGTRINGSQNQTDNSQIEKYCFDDNENNCDEYGGLYQWWEMMQYTTTQGAQGICPTDWHIATDDEWKILEGTVDTQYGVGNSIWDETGFRGFDAGKQLKATTGWFINKGIRTSGFSALPGGWWDSVGGYWSMGSLGFWWTSTESSSSSFGLYRKLENGGNDQIFRHDDTKYRGFSVRCIKD